MDQISSNLLKRHFGFSFFNVFSPFRSLLFFSFAAVIDLLLLLLPLKKLLRKRYRDGHFYYGVATCSRRKFCSEFFTQLSGHFRSVIFQAPLSKSLWSGYHWKDLFLLQKLSTNDDDLWGGANAKACRGWLRAARESMGETQLFPLMILCHITRCLSTLKAFLLRS